ASRALRLSTEASRRFERGLDPEATARAAARAAELVVALGGGQAASGTADAYPAPQPPRLVRTSLERIGGLLGRSYTREEVVGVLGRLGFDVRAADGHLEATVPTWRQDVEGPADVAEEVARITGYDAIPNTLPAGRVPEPYSDLSRRWGVTASRALAAAGLQEVITYSLVDEGAAERVRAEPSPAGDGSPAPIRIANPLSAEASTLRITL